MDITHQKIVDYWADNQSECGLSIDWAEAHKLCWRCAHKRQLQRCHIIPRSLGGPENPSNLVLLCAQCRSEAPNVDDSNFMWVWLRAMQSNSTEPIGMKEALKNMNISSVKNHSPKLKTQKYSCLKYS